MAQNYPNPFNPITEIGYTLPKATDVQLEIFNILGKNKVPSAAETTGPLQCNWDGRNESGMQMPSGVYFYRICAGKFIKSRKMVLLK
ncbi:MAG: T9SS type A sorting domain-containing protein [Calditrichia bacterium]